MSYWGDGWKQKAESKKEEEQKPQEPKVCNCKKCGSTDVCELCSGNHSGKCFGEGAYKDCPRYRNSFFASTGFVKYYCPETKHTLVFACDCEHGFRMSKKLNVRVCEGDTMKPSRADIVRKMLNPESVYKRVVKNKYAY